MTGFNNEEGISAMEVKKGRRWPTAIVYLLLLFIIAWQARGLAQLLGSGGSFPQGRSVKVSVAGDVEHPGAYRIPEGTTQLELLQQAGVRPTSNLSDVNLLSSATQAKTISITTRSQAVDLSSSAKGLRLQAFSGDVVVTARDGNQIPLQAGMPLHDGDELQTLGSAQAGLTVGDLGKIDCDDFSDLLFEHAGVESDNEETVDIRQKSGTCWYSMGQNNINGSYRIATPAAAIIAAGKAADFLVAVQSDRVSVSCIGGSVHAEKSGGTETINLIAGQTAIVFIDARPFQLSRTTVDLGIAERFAQVAVPGSPAGTTATGEEKKNAAESDHIVNVFVGEIPYFFGVVSLQPGKGLITVVHLPPQLRVDEYARGIETLDQAYLYGGPAFVASLLEPLLDIRIDKYCVMSRSTISEFASLFGGQLAPGNNSTRMGSSALLKYLLGSNTLPADTRRRCNLALTSLFEGVKSKSITITMPIVSSLLNTSKTNMTAPEIMGFYSRLVAEPGLSRKDLLLPTIEKRDAGRLLSEPDEARCRSLLQSN
jgi:hypothetical protein